MPLVTANPRGQQDGSIRTQFTDTTNTSLVTYTYPTTQSSLIIENSGERVIYVTVGGVTNQAIQVDTKYRYDGSFTSFSIRSDVNSQEFIATAIYDGSINARLAEKAQQTDIQNIINPTIDLNNTPILTFIDDDVTIQSYNNWMTLGAEKNVKVSLATVPNWLGKTIDAAHTCMTLDQLKEMYNSGHEPVSHGWDSWSVDNYLDNPDRLQLELPGTRQWLIDNGFTRNETYNYFVYPQGLGTGRVQEIKNAVKQYYKYGINVTETTLSNGVFDSYNVPRVTGDGMSSATLKAKLDTILANKGWMIVLTHSHHMVDQDGNNYNTWAQRYRDLIDYARVNNVRIMTFGEAVKLRGNVLSIGDYANGDSFYVNKSGQTNLNVSATIQMPVTFKTIGNPPDIDLPIESYTENTETVVFCSFAVPSCGNSAGTMRVVRGGNHFSYALFMPIDSTKIYKRKWDDYQVTPVWTPWMDISNPTHKLVASLTDVNADISTYEVNRETIVDCALLVPDCGNMPGIMKVYRSSNAHFSYATFTTVASPESYKIYKRMWNDYLTTPAWGTWALINS